MKKVRRDIWIIVAVVVVACGKPKEEKSTKIISRVGEKEITENDFEAFLKFKRIVAADNEKKEKVLDDYLEREALAKAIEGESLLDKERIDAELNEFRKEMIISRYFEAYLKEKVTKKAVSDYYKSHSKEYEQEKIKVAHILVRVNERMDEIEKQAKLTRINEAYGKVKAGASFEEIVKDYSEDKVSLKKGGDIGWIKNGAIDPKFSETVFSMKKGEVSKPFKTKFGYHIVSIVEDKKIVKSPLRTVEGDIRYQLREKAKKDEIMRLKKKLVVKKFGR